MNNERTFHSILQMIGCVIVIFIFLFASQRRSVGNFDFLPISQWKNFSTEYIELSSKKVYGQRALEIINFFMPKSVEGKKIIRVGGRGDGGYYMLDDFISNSVAYSFGIGPDYSWDTWMASHGMKVYMFDPTIQPLNLKNDNLKFYSLGIAGSVMREKNLTTFEEILSLDNNLHKTNMILKMDIEGWEWETLSKTSVIDHFSQIVLEFHDFKKIVPDEQNYENALNVLKKLNRTHQVVMVHGNNWDPTWWSFGGVPFVDVLEVSYVAREGRRFCSFRHKNEDYVDDRNYGWSAETFLWWVEKQKNEI